MDRKKLIREMESIVGKGNVLTDRTSLSVYEYDASLCQGKPDAVAFVTKTQQVSQLVKLANRAGIPFLARGSGTNLSGGTLPTRGGLVINLCRMNKILELDFNNLTALVEPGLYNLALQNVLAPYGYYYAPDPASQQVSTLGGNVGENSGGPHCLKYGVTSNHVLGAEVVLPSGEIVWFGGPAPDPPGPDILGLFVGSEGTLGIVTRVAVRLFPIPRSRQTVMAAADSFDAVIGFLDRLKKGLAGTLSAYEVMWNNYYAGVTGPDGHRAPLDRGHAFYIIAEAEGANPGADEVRFESQLADALDAGVIVDAVVPKSDTEREALWAVREGFEAVLPGYIYDVSLPIRNMTRYVERLNATLDADWPGAIAYVFGHIADGNLHIFTAPHDGGMYRERSDAIVYGCLEGLEGSVSAEHGIGLGKREQLHRSRSPEELQLMLRMKRMLDPGNILNPNKIFTADDVSASI